MNRFTTLLAWWGAVISTAVLAWDVYKWRKTGQQRLSVRANGNLQDAHSRNPQKFIGIIVTNNGDRPVTIGLITFRYFKSKFRKWGKQESEQRGLFNPGTPTAPLPYKLDVGASWRCVVNQTPQIEKMSRDGFFYVEVEDTSTSNWKKFARSRFVVDD
jgi:hypothetical protein